VGRAITNTGGTGDGGGGDDEVVNSFAGWSRAERQRRGWDVPEMARRLARSAGAGRGGLPDDECLRQYVRRWEQGKVAPSERYLLLYARAFGLEPGQLQRQLGGRGGAVLVPGSGVPARTGDAALLALAGDVAAALSSEARADLMRAGHDLEGERTGAVAGERLLEAVEYVGLGQPRRGAVAAGPRRVGNWHVAQVETATSVFRQWDNEFGGGLRRKAVVGQLSEVTALLAGPFSDEQAGRRLFAAVADLAQLARFSSAEGVFA
jgi:transcriptional regulator with XRE-family HTH domain